MTVEGGPRRAAISGRNHYRTSLTPTERNREVRSVCSRNLSRRRQSPLWRRPQWCRLPLQRVPLRKPATPVRARIPAIRVVPRILARPRIRAILVARRIPVRVRTRAILARPKRRCNFLLSVPVRHAPDDLISGRRKSDLPPFLYLDRDHHDRVVAAPVLRPT